MKPCSVCQVYTSSKCSHCTVVYCSDKCQLNDWESHKAACWYQQAISGDEDDPVTFELILKSATAGFPSAQTICGFHLATGKGCKQDIDKAIIWLSKQKNPISNALLAKCYMIKDMMGKAEEFAAKSAKYDYSYGQYLYGHLLIRRRSFHLGVHWLTLASDQDFPEAHLELAALYRSEGDKKNMDFYLKRAKKHAINMSSEVKAAVAQSLKKSAELGCPTAKEALKHFE